MTFPLTRIVALAAFVAGFAAAPAVTAQTGAAALPNKPLRIVVTFTSGGAPDILARLIGERLRADWGQPVVVDNKPGAGGNTGAMFAPAGTPKPIVDKLQVEVKKILLSPEIGKRLAEIGLEVVASTPEELASYQRTEIAKWARVVKESGAKVE